MPTQATSRRDPRNTGKGISIHHGFTVIELMMSLGVLAVITSLALPSYRTIMEKRQVTSGAEQIGAFLSSAQLEAVKRNQFVAVAYADNASNWCLGMRADFEELSLVGVSGCDCFETDPGAANACALDGALRVFRSEVLNYPGVLDSATVGDDNNYFIFHPVRGLMVELDQTTELELSSDQDLYAMNVQVTPTGRVKICSDTERAEISVPGFAPCQ